MSCARVRPIPTAYVIHELWCLKTSRPIASNQRNVLLHPPGCPPRRRCPLLRWGLKSSHLGPPIRSPLLSDFVCVRSGAGCSARRCVRLTVPLLRVGKKGLPPSQSCGAIVVVVPSLSWTTCNARLPAAGIRQASPSACTANQSTSNGTASHFRGSLTYMFTDRGPHNW